MLNPTNRGQLVQTVQGRWASHLGLPKTVGKTVKPLNPIHHHPEFLKFRMQRAIPYNTRKPRRDMFWNEALSIYFTLTFIYCHMVNM